VSHKCLSFLFCSIPTLTNPPELSSIEIIGVSRNAAHSTIRSTRTARWVGILVSFIKLSIREVYRLGGGWSASAAHSAAKTVKQTTPVRFESESYCAI
jgi:hypothetical protein